MSQRGLGSLINHAFGYNAGGDIYKVAQGKTIAKVWLDKTKGDGGALRFRFTDGSGMMISDAGRSCCESRYMNTDDDLNPFEGAKLVDIEIASGPEETAEYGDVKESQFMKVNTDKGTFTVVNYNEHNGYYGGIDPKVEGDSDE